MLILQIQFDSIQFNSIQFQINYTEFLASTLEARVAIEEDLIAQAFDQMDQDKSGYISRKNLCSILGSTMCNPTDCDRLVKDILAEVDTDGDGKISYDEFAAMYKNQKLQPAKQASCCSSSCK